VSDASEPGSPRGSMVVYGVAFVVMLAAGVLLGLAAREFLRETGLLWASIGLSAGAVVLAVVSLVLPRRS
jgi:Na+/proline symporter